MEYKEAFRQQTIIGWEHIFTGKFAKGWRNCWTEHQHWATKFAILNDDLGQSVLVLQGHHSIWRKNEQLCTSAEETDGGGESVEKSDDNMEQLVGDAHIRMNKKTLKTAASITIATWLDEILDLLRQIMREQKESIIMSCADPEDLCEADIQFKRKINAARGMTLRNPAE